MIAAALVLNAIVFGCIAVLITPWALNEYDKFEKREEAEELDAPSETLS